MQTWLHIPVGRQKIAASLHRPAGQDDSAWPIVICCHGLTGTRFGTCYRLVALGRRLADRGIGCLRFDFRGCGESDGRFEDITAQSLLQDVLAVHDTVRLMPGPDANRLGVVGSSFGAYTAARAAAHLSGLKCLVFLAPVADPHTLVRRDMTDAAWASLRKDGWIEHHGLRLGATFFDTLPREDVPGRLAKTAAPLLIYHGMADRDVPFEQGRAYESALRYAGAEVEFRPLDTSDHAMRSVTATDSILTGSERWLCRHLT